MKCKCITLDYMKFLLSWRKVASVVFYRMKYCSVNSDIGSVGIHDSVAGKGAIVLPQASFSSDQQRCHRVPKPLFLLQRCYWEGRHFQNWGGRKCSYTTRNGCSSRTGSSTWTCMTCTFLFLFPQREMLKVWLPCAGIYFSRCTYAALREMRILPYLDD